MSENRVAVVTGAGSGIGAATAERFVRDGFKVVVNGRTESKLREVSDRIGSDRSLVQVGDVSDPGDVEALIGTAVEKFGRLDVLVNNAGVAVFEEIVQLSVDDWDSQMAINVRGPFLTTQSALPHLEATRGSVVNVSSVSGMRGDWNGFAYNATKGALSNMTRALGLDFGAKGVRINAVAPSLTRTDMSTFVRGNADVLRAFEDRIPMGRAAEPEEVADVIAFLASHDARFVNGVVLPVDGGLSASNGQPKIL